MFLNKDTYQEALMYLFYFNINDMLKCKLNKRCTYLRQLTPFLRLCWRCHQKDSILAFLHQLLQRNMGLEKRKHNVLYIKNKYLIFSLEIESARDRIECWIFSMQSYLCRILLGLKVLCICTSIEFIYWFIDCTLDLKCKKIVH